MKTEFQGTYECWKALDPDSWLEICRDKFRRNDGLSDFCKHLERYKIDPVLVGGAVFTVVPTNFD